MSFTIIQSRRGLAADWTSSNPILHDGEVGLEKDSRKFKWGDGVTHWNALPYATAGNTGGVFVSGTLAAPNLVSAGGGVGVSPNLRQYQYIASTGGAIVVASNPAIAAGSSVGQELILEGTSNINTIAIPYTATGVDLNGTIIMKAGSRLYLVWNGSVWGEVSRK